MVGLLLLVLIRFCYKSETDSICDLKEIDTTFFFETSLTYKKRLVFCWEILSISILKYIKNITVS